MCCVSATAQERSDKPIRIAVFPLLNQSGNAEHAILVYSLREKLSAAFAQNTRFETVDLETINRRVLDKNLSVSNNLSKPRLLQYIGGLLEADIMIWGDFQAYNTELIISATIISSDTGSLIRTYRVTGSFIHIDAAVSRLVQNCAIEITAYSEITDQVSSNNTAHSLGLMVANGEKQEESLPAKPLFKNIISTYTQKPELLYPLINADTYILSYTLNQMSKLLAQTKDTVIHFVFGMSFMMQALYLYEQDKEIEAEQSFKTALQILPENNIVLCRYADFKYDKNQLTQAIDLYLTCIQYYPDASYSYIQLAQIYLQKQAYASAVYYLQEALKRAPENSSVYSMLAKAYALNHRMDKAIDTLQDGLKKFPEDMELSYLLSAYISQLQNPKQINK